MLPADAYRYLPALLHFITALNGSPFVPHHPSVEGLKYSRMWIMSQIAGVNVMNLHLMIGLGVPIVA
jgi:hypothetical protein